MCRRTLVLLTLTGLLALLGLAVGSAFYTSSAVVTGNPFTTGNVVLTTNPSAVLITYLNMVPGDRVTQPLRLSNAGSLGLRYAMTSSATNADGKDLAQALWLEIKSGLDTCDAEHFAASGTLVYSGSLAEASFGSPAVGPLEGDRVLNAGAGEALCFQAMLRVDSGNELQEAATTATFTFLAEQTKNNGTDGHPFVPTAAPQPTQCLGGIQGQVIGLVAPANASLEVIDLSHRVFGTTTTDSGGHYAFAPLARTNYLVRLTAPAGYAIQSPALQSAYVTRCLPTVAGVNFAVAAFTPTAMNTATKTHVLPTNTAAVPTSTRASQPVSGTPSLTPSLIPPSPTQTASATETSVAGSPTATSTAAATNTTTPTSMAATATNTATPTQTATSTATNTATPVSPILNTMAPGALAAGSPDQIITITGTNLVPSSIVQWNGTDLPTVYVSPTQLQVGLSAAQVSSVGVSYVTIRTPGAPNVSSPLAFYVTQSPANVVNVNTTQGNTGSFTAAIPNAQAVVIGAGTVSLAQFDANPEGSTTFTANGVYLDVHIKPGSSLSQVALTTCNLNGGKALYWWDGSMWSPVQNQMYDSETGCVTVTFTPTSSPTLANLTGTYFGAGQCVGGLFGHVYESGIPRLGILVTLKDASNTHTLSWDTTDVNGIFAVGMWPDGQYHLSIQVPSGYAALTPADVTVQISSCSNVLQDFSIATFTPTPTVTNTPTLTPTPQATVQINGLVGYWPMEEGYGDVLVDASGNDRVAAMSGVAWSTSVPPALASHDSASLSFNGTAGSYILQTDPYQTSSFTAYTVAMWVNPAVAGNMLIHDRDQGLGYSANPHMQLNISGGHFVHIADDGSTKRSIVGTTTVTAGTWYHVAIVASNGGPAKLYVNGVSEGTPVTTPVLYTGSDYFYLGRNKTGGPYFNGLLDDVRYYNRALGDAEMAALAAGSVVTTAPTATPTPATYPTMTFNGIQTLTNPVNVQSSYGTQAHVRGDLAWQQPAYTSALNSTNYPSWITFGLGNSHNWYMNPAGSSPNQWVYVDLGTSRPIGMVLGNHWCYYSDVANYPCIETDFIASSDAQAWSVLSHFQTVYAYGQYWRSLTLKTPLSARYIGMYFKGSTVYTSNMYLKDLVVLAP